MQNHPRKMKSVKLKEKNAVEWKPIKFPKKKKKKEELARLKTRKGGLGKN